MPTRCGPATREDPVPRAMTFGRCGVAKRYHGGDIVIIPSWRSYGAATSVQAVLASLSDAIFRQPCLPGRLPEPSAGKPGNLPETTRSPRLRNCRGQLIDGVEGFQFRPKPMRQAPSGEETDRPAVKSSRSDDGGLLILAHGPYQRRGQRQRSGCLGYGISCNHQRLARRRRGPTP